MLNAVSLLPLLTSFAAPQDPVPDIRAAVTKALKSNRAIMIAVVHKGQVILAEARGKLGGEKLANAKTLFPLGDASRIVANLVFARMQEAKQLDFDKKVNACIAGFTLRDETGAVMKDATLRDVIVSKVDFLPFENFLPVAELGNWTARRAALDHAVAVKEGHVTATTHYAVAQAAAEQALGKSWGEIVRSHLRANLGLASLVADVREGLPERAATTFRKGLFDMPTKERSGHGAIPSATGAWVDAADLAKLLQALLRAAKGVDKADDIDSLNHDKLAFAGFASSRWWELEEGELVHTWVEIETTAPGMCGGVCVFPQYQTAWGVFVNERSNTWGMPPKLKAMLMKRLLPKPRDAAKGWATAVGLGGGGAMLKPFSEARRGEWVAEIRVHGKPVKLRMKIGERQVRSVQLGENRPRRAGFSRHLGYQLEFTLSNLLPLRKDRRVGYGFELRWNEGKAPTWSGTLRARSGEYCDIRYPVTFRKVAAKKK